MPTQLRLEPWREIDGQIELAATLEWGGKSESLWWRVPATWRDSITTFADPFVIGFVFQMMQAGESVVVHAPVSPSLLVNLESFMNIWHSWVPSKYTRVSIRSVDETEPPEPMQPKQFAMPFSCGVDSCFTAWRHRQRLSGRSHRDVALGVTMFGFDIRARQNNANSMYARLAHDAGLMLAGIGMAHVEISTNFRDLSSLWMHSHGTQLASGLSLFGRRFGGALIPDSVPLNTLNTIWGSHPLSDPLLGSDRFAIIPDGVGIPRWQKIKALLDWPDALSGLRVCFGEAGATGNCGKCEKCIRTALAFTMLDQTPPANLPANVSPKLLQRIRPKHDITIGFWREIVDGIEVHGKQDEPWARRARAVLRRAKRLRVEKALKQPFLPLRDRIRAIFRGSAMSKRQIAAQTPPNH